jgi:segregation and condensation protein B
VIAYKQPVTRGEIDEIRGVESSGVIDTLLDRKLIKITGRKEALGKPLLYGTTQDFLKHFGLAHLSELPLIEDMPKEELQTDNVPEPELPFEDKETEINIDGTDLVAENAAANGAQPLAEDNTQAQFSDENAASTENILDESIKND